MKLSPERTWINQTDEPEVPKVKTLPHLPEAQFSAIQDKDNLYNQWYANDDALPPFPVTSPGLQILIQCLELQKSLFVRDFIAILSL